MTVSTPLGAFVSGRHLYKYYSAGGGLQGIIFKPIIALAFSICLCFSAEGMGAFSGT